MAAGSRRKGGLDCASPVTVAHHRRRGDSCQTSSDSDGPVVLCVLDGWGYRPEREGNAIALARAPNWQALWGRHPRTLLNASELAVGLPEGQMGNSEVGHLNLGAGRVVPQDLVRISQSIQRGDFYALAPLVELGAHLRQTGGTLHLVGLLGPGRRARASTGTCSPASSSACGCACRRSPSTASSTAATPLPRSAPRWCGRCCSTCAASPATGWTSPRSPAATTAWTATIAGSAPGRRTTPIAHGVGIAVEHPVLAVQAAYQRGETDEFVRPLVHHRDGRPVATLEDGDGDLLLQLPQRPHAPDRRRARRRRASTASTPVGGRRCTAVTMTQYDQTFPDPAGLPAVHPGAHPGRGPGRHTAAPSSAPRRPRSTRTSPTSSTAATSRPTRARSALLVPVPRVATYDLMPEMSARRRHRRALRRARSGSPRLPPLQLRQRRHGGAHRGACPP